MVKFRTAKRSTHATIGEPPALTMLFRAYEAPLTKAGFLVMGGQIIDDAIVSAPKQHDTDGVKADIRAGPIPANRKDKPAKLAQKDRDARLTVKFSRQSHQTTARRASTSRPAFGYKNLIGIDRRHGLIRTWPATHAARHDGAQLPNLMSKTDTASTVRADNRRKYCPLSDPGWRSDWR